ncbi:MAG TPA: prephenate dehydrogenase/arogenate dehydrogenase family protein [Chthoniobacterales bacterium]
MAGNENAGTAEFRQKMSPFREIAILGPGLLGGSLALALTGSANTRLWARRADAVAEILEKKIASMASIDLKEVVHGADLIIFCTPVEVMREIAFQISSHILPGTIVTDVGSVKERVLRENGQLFANFVGSHPMAGSEQGGLDAARKDLFEGAVCILTPDQSTNTLALQKVTAFWDALGCEVQLLSPREHDEIVGAISHLPHLTASALVRAATSIPGRPQRFAGQGFRDSTRIASGPPPMWAGILLSNRQAVRTGIRRLISELETADSFLETADEEGLRKFLTEAKTIRDSVRSKQKENGGI